MLGTKEMTKVMKKESAKLLKKFGVEKVFDLEVYMQMSKKKAAYFVFMTTDQKGTDDLNASFSLRKSIKKTVKNGVLDTLKVILVSSANAKKVDLKDQDKAIKKYLRKRIKPIIKALK